MNINWSAVEALAVAIPVFIGILGWIGWRLLKYEQLRSDYESGQKLLKSYKETADANQARIASLESRLSSVPVMEARLGIYERNRIRDGMVIEALHNEVAILERIFQVIMDASLPDAAKKTIQSISAHLDAERTRSRRQITEWENQERFIQDSVARAMPDDPRISPMDASHI